MMSPVKALVSNFASGLSVILGAIVVLSSEVDNATIGLFLAFGGGVYLHIAATECMPKIYDKSLTAYTRLGCIASMILGAVLIGLVLLDHEHCVPDSATGGDGHHHHG